MTAMAIPRRSGTRYQDWRDRAACKGASPEIFFPESGQSTRQAKAFCAACPVRVQCLRFAVASPEPHGVWGALDERERRGMRPAGPRTCASGMHLMTPDNTYTNPATGTGTCRACKAGHRPGRPRAYVTQSTKPAASQQPRKAVA